MLRVIRLLNGVNSIFFFSSFSSSSSIFSFSPLLVSSPLSSFSVFSSFICSYLSFVLKCYYYLFSRHLLFFYVSAVIYKMGKDHRTIKKFLPTRVCFVPPSFEMSLRTSPHLLFFLEYINTLLSCTCFLVCLAELVELAAEGDSVDRRFLWRGCFLDPALAGCFLATVRHPAGLP